MMVMPLVTLWTTMVMSVVMSMVMPPSHHCDPDATSNAMTSPWFRDGDTNGDPVEHHGDANANANDDANGDAPMVP